MAGCVPILGRLKSAALFRLDECMRPVYDPDGGYVDDCFAALSTSDNMNEGEAFTRNCADGSILYHEDGKNELQSVTVDLDLNAEPDADWMAVVGLSQPIENDGQIVGWTRCTSANANLLVGIWQEVLGSDACDEEGGGGGWRLHLYALKNARITFEGNLGAQDAYVRVTGNTVPNANLGKGPIPFLAGQTPAFFEDDLLVCHHTILTNGVVGPPSSCGVIATTAPVEDLP